MSKSDDTRTLRYLEVARTYPGLEQLICAALADPNIAAELLAHPAAALRHLEPDVRLSPVERELVLSIVAAADIHDYAAQLHRKVQQKQEHNR